MLLPGMDGTGAFFAPLLRALPSSMKTAVIAYPPSASMNYEDLCVYAASRLPDGPVILVGESFSGPVATLLASRFPDRVRGLILASSFVSAPRPRGLLPLLSVPGLVQLSKLLARFALLGLDGNPEIITLTRKVIPELDAGLIRFRAALILGADYLEQFANSVCPVLILHGTRDILVPVSYVRKLTRLRPDATVRSIDGPHMLLQVKPAQCAAEIVNFFSTCNLDAA